MLDKIICLVGPTACGKTDIALKLVEQFNAVEIISMDSALVYQGMDIGTAKPSASILSKVPHHLVNILPPNLNYSTAQFYQDVKQLVEAIHEKKKIPLIVGGTMMYYHTLYQGISTLPPANINVREMLNQQAKTQGLMALHQQLAAIDLVSAQKIHPNDKQRLQRALEIFITTGLPMSQLIEQKTSFLSSYDVLHLGLWPNDREQLRRIIAHRFGNMLKAGFIDEVSMLMKRGDLNLDSPSVRTVGYRQIWQYLIGHWDYQTMEQKAFVATCQLAKRQLTWIKKLEHLHRIECSLQAKDYEKVMALCERFVNKYTQTTSK